MLQTSFEPNFARFVESLGRGNVACALGAKSKYGHCTQKKSIKLMS